MTVTSLRRNIEGSIVVALTFAIVQVARATVARAQDYAMFLAAPDEIFGLRLWQEQNAFKRSKLQVKTLSDRMRPM